MGGQNLERIFRIVFGADGQQNSIAPEFYEAALKAPVTGTDPRIRHLQTFSSVLAEDAAPKGVIEIEYANLPRRPLEATQRPEPELHQVASTARREIELSSCLEPRVMQSLLAIPKHKTEVVDHMKPRMAISKGQQPTIEIRSQRLPIQVTRQGHRSYRIGKECREQHGRGGLQSRQTLECCVQTLGNIRALLEDSG